MWRNCDVFVVPTQWAYELTLSDSPEIPKIDYIPVCVYVLFSLALLRKFLYGYHYIIITLSNEHNLPPLI